MTPARAAALAALRTALDRGQDLQAAVDDQLPGLCRRDARLATELAYGTARLRGRLDALLGFVLPRREGLSRLARRLLELAAYELLFLRPPIHATCAWAGAAARRLLGPRLAALVHAALRRLAEQPELAHDEAAFRAAGGSPAQWFSLPQWVWELWVAERGPEAARDLAAMSLAPAPPGVRLRPGAEDLRQRLLPLAVGEGRFGLALGRWPAFLDDALAQGGVRRQSLASQEAVAALAPETWPEPVWDACAGRGGKALLVADLGKRVWASDPHGGRLAGLAAEARRLGLCLPVFRADACRPPLAAPPGTVLLDAPCTGLGVLARRPDIRWKRTPEDLEALARLQGELLDAAAGILPAGGCLAYLTCTVTRAENEDQVARFLARHPEFCLRAQGTTPHALGEVLFFALLERRG